MTQIISLKGLLLALLLMGISSLNAQQRSTSSHFLVEIEGVAAGYFKGVDGLNAEVEVVSKRHSGVNTTISLRRGTKISPRFHRWAKQCKQGTCKPLTLTISRITNGKVSASYKIRVTDVTTYSFDGKGNDVVTEEITFVGAWPKE